MKTINFGCTLRQDMKSYYRIISLAFVLFVFGSFTGINEDINAALKEGNAFKVARFFDAKVDLTILEESDLLSKLEAEKMLYDFFYTHHPTDFSVLHEGESKSGLQYTIGKLKTDNGTFRLSYYINKSGDSHHIQQMIIDAE